MGRADQPGKEWLALEGAADFLDVSKDTIKRRRIPWKEAPVPYRIRFKWLKLDEKAPARRRYCRQDLEALLASPTLRPGRPPKLFNQPQVSRQ